MQANEDSLSLNKAEIPSDPGGEKENDQDRCDRLSDEKTSEHENTDVNTSGITRCDQVCKFNVQTW